MVALVVFIFITLGATTSKALTDLSGRPANVHRQTVVTTEAAPSNFNSGDNAWMLVSCALVLMMTAPGLILFYGGLVRAKNVLGTMMHSLILMALVSMIWMIFGYSMAFAPGNAFVGNPLTYFMLKGVGGDPNGDYSGTVPQETFMLFEMMFAIITPALISGAVAERIKFKGYVIFTYRSLTGLHGHRTSSRTRSAGVFPSRAR